MSQTLQNNRRKAIFLDRDGVIISNSGNYYIWKDQDVVINPGVAGVLRTWKERGYLLIVVTNQGGVSRGLYTREDVENIHGLIGRMLAGEGAVVDEFYYCPHHADLEACLCRKPLPLLLEKAMARYGIDPASSWMVGDLQRDVDAGRAAGLRTILVEPNSDLRLVVDRIS
jgi:D-glycero-D-manno-heptose 1,7-bisphosphate phosphatase